ncbi:MAG: hypothetical protein HY815_31180 [Candidatus Riflebacteria bacterium]|nr:hypothetical protein [Candidatus Riflebacteria bacterium]
MAACTSLAVPDADRPAHSRSVWYSLGEIPASIAIEQGLDVSVRVANLEPYIRCWLRFGDARRVCVRNVLATSGSLVSPATLPSREYTERHATAITLALPPGFLRPSDRTLSVMLESLRTAGGSDRDLTPQAIWFVDMVLSEPRGGF